MEGRFWFAVGWDTVCHCGEVTAGLAGHIASREGSADARLTFSLFSVWGPSLWDPAACIQSGSFLSANTLIVTLRGIFLWDLYIPSY